jgi:hypothetical protein
LIEVNHGENKMIQAQEQDEQQQWQVYAKLQKARIKLQGMALKKSGYNKFADFRYFELGDFLPSINIIFEEIGLCSVFSINSDCASLKIVDTDTKGEIYFSSPLADAATGKAPPIQALGSQHTYLRRYLFLNALEITEHDFVDATIDKDKPQSAKPITVDVFSKLSEADQNEIRSYGVDVISLLSKDDVAGAVEYINMLELDADSKTALWSLLDSKQRSAIKKFTTR